MRAACLTSLFLTSLLAATAGYSRTCAYETTDLLSSAPPTHEEISSDVQPQPAILVEPLDTTSPLTLLELIDTALKNHPSTQRLWWSVQGAMSGYSAAKSAYAPKVDLIGSGSHGRNFQFINGPDVTYSKLSADLSLSWLLYDFGARSACVKAAKQTLEAVNWQKNGNIQKVILRVVESAYQTLHAQQNVEAMALSVQDAEQLLLIARELHRVGLSPISDIYTAQSSLCQMKIDLSNYEALLQIQRGRLAANIGLSAETKLQLQPVEYPLQMQQEQSEQLLATAKQKRSDLMAKRASVAKADSELEQVKASGRPKLSMRSSAGGSSELNSYGRSGDYRVSINLEIPIFDGFQTSYKNRMALANAQIASQELEELELEISLEVLTHSQMLQAATNMLPQARENLINCQLAYESTLERYQAGQTSIQDLSSSLRSLSRARVQCSDIKTRWLVSMASLAYATGTLDTGTLDTGTLESSTATPPSTGTPTDCKDRQ